MPLTTRASSAQRFEISRTDEAHVRTDPAAHHLDVIEQESGVRGVDGRTRLPVVFLKDGVRLREVVPGNAWEQMVLDMVIDLAHRESNETVADNGPGVREHGVVARHSVFGQTPDVENDDGEQHGDDPELDEVRRRDEIRRRYGDAGDEKILCHNTDPHARSCVLETHDGDSGNVYRHTDEEHRAIYQPQRDECRGGILEIIRILLRLRGGMMHLVHGYIGAHGDKSG